MYFMSPPDQCSGVQEDGERYRWFNFRKIYCIYLEYSHPHLLHISYMALLNVPLCTLWSFVYRILPLAPASMVYCNSKAIIHP